MYRLVGTPSALEMLSSAIIRINRRPSSSAFPKVSHSALELDQPPLPLELDQTRRAGRRRGALMGDAQPDQGGVEDVDARLAEPPQQRAGHHDALVLAAFGGRRHLGSFYASRASA